MSGVFVLKAVIQLDHQ